jgi:hypothetical protein
MSNETKILIMKTIAFILFTTLLCLTIIACKKENKENQPNSTNNCKEDSYSGTWEFVINKDKANEYKDTVTIFWNGNTYLIDNIVSARTDLATRLVYRTEFEQIDIWKDQCNLKYKGSFDGRKL